MKRIHPRQRGFTLVELLVVIAIVALLAGLLLPVLARSRREARKAACQNNLSQFHKAMVLFDQNHNHLREDYPLRLTYLHTGSETGQGAKFVADEKLYICPNDDNRGHAGGKPPAAKDQFTELDEGPGLGNGGDPKCAANAPFCSYMYEFSGAACSWWSSSMLKGTDTETDVDTGGGPDDLPDGKISWQEAKFYQLEKGDDYMPSYPRTWFPIMRCFCHTKRPDTPDGDMSLEIFNLAIDGNYFPSGSKWEIIADANNPNQQ